ncbi:outer membrane beta-barrel protein [Massilia consociata]|uniref:Outer membrane beta-barrel protein n=1 Tax=Massilia consociata TaxID=760117 RepID=A0ABV6FE76_9BURK
MRKLFAARIPAGVRRAGLLAAAAFACAGAAQAEPIRFEATPTTPQLYAGVGASVIDQVVGKSRVHPKLLAGYEFGNGFGVEGGYVRQRKQHLIRPGTAGGSAGFADGYGGFGMYVAVKHILPLTGQLSAFAKLGVSHNVRKYHNWAGTDKATDTGAYGAFGLQYSVTQKVAVTAEYERYGKDKERGAKADAVTVGVKVAF